MDDDSEPLARAFDLRRMIDSSALCITSAGSRCILVMHRKSVTVIQGQNDVRGHSLQLSL